MDIKRVKRDHKAAAIDEPHTVARIRAAAKLY
jgi:hypothetical protein